jgi:hypothetical protein
MKLSRIYFLASLLIFLSCFDNSNAQTFPTTILKDFIENQQFLDIENTPPVAVSDTFYLFTGCDRNSISGNILSNDYDPDGNEIELYYVITPKNGEFSITNDGNFSFIIPTGYLGTLIFEYCITEVDNKNYKDVAEVVIFVKPDCDCDNVSDSDDLDNDNDGIIDIHEGNGELDSDGDGVPDSFDIDSDNDGITDIVEWQTESFFISPSETDINLNGWDDAYDNSFSIGGIYYEAVDTDKDGEPDFTDTDSDDDGLSDYIEGCDMNNDSIPDIVFLYLDSDNDGLDDAFDTVSFWTEDYNSIGSNSPLPDFNKNGVRNWRDSKNYVPGEEQFLTADQILIYPNPVSSEFSIYIPSSIAQEGTKLFLYSANGVLLEDKIINSVENTVNIENYRSGLYFVKLQFKSFTRTEKLIIRH